MGVFDNLFREKRKYRHRREGYEPKYKWCRECEIVKPISEFYRRKENWDGYFHSCKACMDKRTNRNNHKKQAIRKREKLMEEGATKVCNKCGIEKPLSEFPKNSKKKDGTGNICTECIAKQREATKQKKLERAEQERLYLIDREITLRAGRKNFFNFCQILAPDFFTPTRWHLWLLCNTLQALYERHLTKKYFYALCTMPHIPKWVAEGIDWDRLHDGKPYTKLMINVPPRAGKSRALTMFADWILGKSHENRIITVSYNTDLAANMSRYVRDGIAQQKNMPTDITFSDFFPDCKISKGNSGFMKWALEGQFFNYLGTGMEGTITGVGGSVLIIDDVIKNANEAYNERVLEDIWNWYTGTFMSRAEHGGDGAIEIINFTRWSTKDLCGRILESPAMSPDWANLIIPVEHDGELYCEEILPRDAFERLREGMDTNIFEANYYQKPLDVEGRLFTEMKTYDVLPEGTEGVIAYCDTADEGDDYLACVVGKVKDGEGYITDIYFTQDNMQITEGETADLLVRNGVTNAKIESNNGGKGFARNVERLIWEKYHTKQVNITWFHQTENKMARILTGSTFVINHVYFPEKWDKKWPEFYKAIMGFTKDGKNKHDDGVEALVEFGKMITGDGSVNSYMEMMKRMLGK